MKLQFKLAATALAFASVSAFAGDFAPATDFVLAAPTIIDVATAAAAYDTATANDLATVTASNALIFQGATGGVAIIDQTGPNFALIAQSGAQASTAVIYQLAGGNAAAILQK